MLYSQLSEKMVAQVISLSVSPPTPTPPHTHSLTCIRILNWNAQRWYVMVHFLLLGDFWWVKVTVICKIYLHSITFVVSLLARNNLKNWTYFIGISFPKQICPWFLPRDRAGDLIAWEFFQGLCAWALVWFVCLVWLGSGLCILTQLSGDPEVCLLLEVGDAGWAPGMRAHGSPSATQEGFIEVGHLRWILSSQVLRVGANPCIHRGYR